MNKRSLTSKELIRLALMALIPAALLLAWVEFASAKAPLTNAAPKAKFELRQNNALDYAIGKAGNLVSEGSDDDEDALTFTWKLIKNPAGVVIDKDICPARTTPAGEKVRKETCEIPARYF